MAVTRSPSRRHVVITLQRACALACCAVTLVSARLMAQAQQPAPVYRVATLGADSTNVWDTFHRRLKELGYVEGRNLILERRWSHGYEDRLPTLLAEVLGARPDVLITSMLPPTSRIDPAQCIPILAIAVWEPYGSCRVFPVARKNQAAADSEVRAGQYPLANIAVSDASP